jgi:hypothetical protein
MAGVIRGKDSGFSLAVLGGYVFHGATAILALWLLSKAIGV